MGRLIFTKRKRLNHNPQSISNAMNATTNLKYKVFTVNTESLLKESFERTQVFYTKVHPNYW